MIKTDVLVIGSGAAGLIYALKVASRCPDKKVLIVTKNQTDESNTKYAQGGVAVVLDKLRDNFDSHVADTLRAGDGQCNKGVVAMVVEDAPDRIKELIQFGVAFDLDKSGEYDLGREGGHSYNRVIHHKDNTGEAIEEALLARTKDAANITILEYHQAIDLILSEEEDRCIGAKVLDIYNNSIISVLSNVTALASGGCGAVFENTTNPETSIGDGIAIAERAGAQISNMQYIQFHPTATYEREKKGKLSLITEAMRGAGAKLLNVKGERFMPKYDERGELASRDIVSRAIYQEMKNNGSDFVYLDCREIPQEKLLAHFPNIYEDCKAKGYDLFVDLLPIVPASHYLCGGIDVDMDGKASLDKLYAIGECSNTGLHGANRLASNSLLEALVYGHRAAMDTVKLLGRNKDILSVADESIMVNTDEKNSQVLGELKKQLHQLMSAHVGIVRNNEELQLALKKHEDIESAFKVVYDPLSTNSYFEELRNMLSVTRLIIEHSIEQKQNAGTFYNIDLA